VWDLEFVDGTTAITHHEVDQLHRDVVVPNASLELVERIIGTAA
jgi:hypothetical protein